MKSVRWQLNVNAADVFQWWNMISDFYKVFVCKSQCCIPGIKMQLQLYGAVQCGVCSPELSYFNIQNKWIKTSKVFVKLHREWVKKNGNDASKKELRWNCVEPNNALRVHHPFADVCICEVSMSSELFMYTEADRERMRFNQCSIHWINERMWIYIHTHTHTQRIVE